MAHSTAKRLILTPIQHPEIFEAYHTALHTFWRPHEVDLSADIHDWRQTDSSLREAIEKIVAFFATSDTLVQINILETFQQQIDIMEAQYFYAYQALNENVHSETYSMLLDMYSETPEHRARIVEMIDKSEPIRSKIAWVLKWLNDEGMTLVEKLYVFAIVEGIFFSSSFAFIHAVKQLGVLPGLTYSNELISRDERSHYNFAVLMFHHYGRELRKDWAVDVLREAVKIEQEFAAFVLKENKLMGLSVSAMKSYVAYLANLLAADFSLTAESLYPDVFELPLPHMVNMHIGGKTNFFEKKVSEYHKFEANDLDADAAILF